MKKQSILGIVAGLFGFVLFVYSANSLFGAPAQERQKEIDATQAQLDKVQAEIKQLEVELVGHEPNSTEQAKLNEMAKAGATDQEIRAAFNEQPVDHTENNQTEYIISTYGAERLDDLCFRSELTAQATYFTLYDYYEIDYSNCVSGTPGAYFVDPADVKTETLKYGAEEVTYRYTFMNGTHSN